MAERKNIKDIVRSVASLVGVSRPTTATGSTDPQIIQLVALANVGGSELAARYAWTALVGEATFTSVAAESQGAIDGTILTASRGFDYILNDTIWNRTSMINAGGPLSAARWQAAKASNLAPSPWSQYRIRSGNLYLYPAPPAGQTLAFEYQSRYWVSNAAGDTFRSEFAADDDYPRIDSRLLQLDLVWRWKHAKGLEYGQDFQNFENAYMDSRERDGTRGSAFLDGRERDDYRPVLVAPIGSWNL